MRYSPGIHTTRREKGQIRTPDAIEITPVPHLRIVNDDLAARVDARLAERHQRYKASLKGARYPEKASGKYLLSGGMLICADCGGHFEARKYPWKPSRKTAEGLPPNARAGHPGEVYICSTRRRKPGVCHNMLALSIPEADAAVLSVIEGDVLGTKYINELLTLVDHGDADPSLHFAEERDRLKGEIDKLVGSIAMGHAPESIVAAIRERETRIAKLDFELRRPRVPRPDMDKLRAALTQRAKEWKQTLREEPQVARLLLRKLVGPLTLTDLPERPDFVQFRGDAKAGILDGLGAPRILASPTRLAHVAGQIRRAA